VQLLLLVVEVKHDQEQLVQELVQFYRISLDHQVIQLLKKQQQLLLLQLAVD
jgi:hypothetical protein